jgi:hypothetical protein
MASQVLSARRGCQADVMTVGVDGAGVMSTRPQISMAKGDIPEGATEVKQGFLALLGWLRGLAARRGKGPGSRLSPEGRPRSGRTA